MSWVDGCAEEMAAADELGNSKEVNRIVNLLANKGGGFDSTQPTRDEHNKFFKDEEALAEAWAVFAEEKFAATDAEASRGNNGEYPALETTTDERQDDVPTDEDLEQCLGALLKSKAAGVDGTPVELYQELPTNGVQAESWL